MSRAIGAIAIAGTTVVGLGTLPSPREPSPDAVTPAPVEGVEPVAVEESVPVFMVDEPVVEAVPEPVTVAIETPEPIEPVADMAQPVETALFEPDRLIEATVWGRYVLEPRGAVVLPLVEIVAYDAARSRVLATCRDGLVAIDITDVDRPTVAAELDVAREIGMGPNASLSHVSVDPIGRGVAAVSVLPGEKAARTGRVALVSLERLEVIGSFPVGYGPDAVEFAPDGSAIVVANEGEWAARADGTVDDPPPSVSIVSLDGVRNGWQFEGVSEADIRTVHFSGPAMFGIIDESAPGDPDASVRVHPLMRRSPATDLEPESVAVIDGVAHVSLQENNAVASIDLRTGELLNISTLGTAAHEMDVSDRDGPNLSTMTHGLRMPDQLKAFRGADGRAYIVTANEGDNRGEFGEGGPMVDHGRLSALSRDGRLGNAVDEVVRQSSDGLSRLHACAFMGDFDSDGRIDEPMALGARSVSVFDAQTHGLVGETGSRFASIILENWPSLFNAGSDSEPTRGDTRSDNRGCEPEGVVIGRVGGTTLAFVGLERPGAVAAVDLRDPSSPEVVGMTMIAELGHFGPEGLAFVNADESPLDGDAMLVVACEKSGTVSLWRVVDRYRE